VIAVLVLKHPFAHHGNDRSVERRSATGKTFNSPERIPSSCEQPWAAARLRRR